MKDVREVVDTPLAQWLNRKMSEWRDPETGRRGLTANRLAELSGVSQTLIWEILKVGESTPKADALKKLAGFFGVSPALLFRLAYTPETEAADFPAETKAMLEELEETLSRWSQRRQQGFLEGVVLQAQAWASGGD